MKSKVILLLLFTLIFLGALSSIALAVPAPGNVQEFVQPSGEKFNARIKGDERHNWLVSETGDVLVRDQAGSYQYGVLTSTGLKPGKASFKPASRAKGVLKEKDLLEYLQTAESIDSTDSAVPITSYATTAGPVVSGPQQALILLINFTDISIQNSNPSSWNNLLFCDTGSTVNAFYKEVSQGNFYFNPAMETNGTVNDGVISVSLPYAHPSTNNWINKSKGTVVQEALMAADPAINYASFDTNGDGALMPNELHIITVLAGYERSYCSLGPSVWAHRGQQGGITLDGVNYVGYYTMQGEMHYDHMATVGVFCHELGHDLNLRDLYDLDGSSWGVGIHSLMASGSWGYINSEYQGTTPTHLDPWSKIFLGFVTPQEVTTSGSQTLYADTANFNVLKVPTANPYEYFLVENRQFADFDAALQSDCATSGLAIWHIDESKSSNTDENHKFVDLEEANEGIIGLSQLDTRTGGSFDHYYNPTINPTFSHSSTPNSCLYSGQATNITISTNSTSANSMLVNVETTPLPLAINSLTANKPSPQKIYNPIRWTCDTSGGENVVYKFDVYNYSLLVKAGSWSTNNYFDWIPLGASSYYKIKVSVKEQNDLTALTKTSDYFVVTLF